jgi:hypothetical protein
VANFSELDHGNSLQTAAQRTTNKDDQLNLLDIDVDQLWTDDRMQYLGYYEGMEIEAADLFLFLGRIHRRRKFKLMGSTSGAALQMTSNHCLMMDFNSAHELVTFVEQMDSERR